MIPSLYRMEAPRAVRAVRAIVANPDDIRPVFSLLEALGGDSLWRIHKRLGATPAGRKVLAERPDMAAVLRDREALRAMPEGSLGRAYLAFVEGGNITPEGIRAAAEQGQRYESELPADIAAVQRWMRDTHDLWHAVTGYGNDVLGELGLLAFTFAQTWNPGIGVLVAVGAYKTHGAPHARRLILEGFRRGRRAAWLPEQDWAGLLALPLATVRARLNVDELPAYAPVYSLEVRAAA